MSEQACRCTSVHPRRRRGERGNAALEFVTLGLLLLIPTVYILLAAFDVQRGAFAVTAASRSAARAYSLSDSEGEGQERARRAAQIAMEDQGIHTMPDVDPQCEDSTNNRTSCLAPGAIVEVRVSTRVELPLVPDFLGANGGSIPVTATHRVPVGTYIEGVPDEEE